MNTYTSVILALSAHDTENFAIVYPNTIFHLQKRLKLEKKLALYTLVNL